MECELEIKLTFILDDFSFSTLAYVFHIFLFFILEWLIFFLYVCFCQEDTRVN